jgi:hypothetical protein
MFKEEGHHLVLEIRYKKKYKKNCSIVENAFKIFKTTFQELLTKSKLSVSFHIICFHLLLSST